MEVRDNPNVAGKGLYATQKYTKGSVIFVLNGEEYDHPTRETIHIGNGKHIYDPFGIYINHSFQPTVWIDGYNVIALIDIDIDDELTFNYNENEIQMASPFYVDGILVQGREN